MIDMNECSFHVGKDFNRVLKLLANIMCFPQLCGRGHDNVDLDEVVWAALGNKNLLGNHLLNDRWDSSSHGTHARCRSSRCRC